VTADRGRSPVDGRLAPACGLDNQDPRGRLAQSGHGQALVVTENGVVAGDRGDHPGGDTGPFGTQG